MNIQLTRELEQIVEANVRSGRYRTASDVVAAALRLMDQTVPSKSDVSGGDQIEEGWLAAQRGELIDGEEVFARIDSELEVLEEPVLK